MLSLYALSKRACIKNIESITDVGDIPYDHLRPILSKIRNPQHLYDLEKSSPQLQGADEELWVEFIKRDIENGGAKLVESGKAPTYKLYKKLLRGQQEDMERDAENLKAQMKSIESGFASRKSQLVEAKNLPKLPRASNMRVEKSRSGQIRHSDNSKLTFTSGSKTKTTTGAGVINKARREAKEMSMFAPSKKALTVPTHMLNNRSSAVVRAPRSLVSEQKRPEVQATNAEVSKSGSKGTGPSSPPQPQQTLPQPAGGYRVPRQNAALGGRPNVPPPRKRAPVNPLMPSKRRRLS